MSKSSKSFKSSPLFIDPFVANHETKQRRTSICKKDNKINNKRDYYRQNWLKLTSRNDSRNLIKNVWNLQKGDMVDYNKKIQTMHKKYLRV